MIYFLKNQGQSLVELLVAVAVILLVVLSLVSLVTISLNSVDFSKKRALAASYAQEGMENMRIFRDTGWATFLSYASPSPGKTYGFAGSQPSGSCPTTPNLAALFIRCVNMIIITTNPPKVQATVTVSWVDAKGTHQSQLVSYFTQWR